MNKRAIREAKAQVRWFLSQHVPPAFRKIFERALSSGASPDAVIAACCLACRRFDPSKVSRCAKSDCDLHQCRPIGDDWREVAA